MNSEAQSRYLQNIDSETMLRLPKASFSGEIVMVNQLSKTYSAVKYLSNYRVLGFDTETKPVFQKGIIRLPSLLQLSTDKRAFLFRLSATGIPYPLKNLLENADIIKAGAAVHGDIKSLKTLRRMKPAGFVDIQDIVGQYGIADKSVQKIAAIVLGVRISKSQRLTNWANPVLTAPQQAYAATDAWVCREVYIKLKNYESNFSTE
ncbi:MAG: 3'-5' exonuclease domain-containing protein 2 [Prevotellaceae bacterium]|nr:3'-5' exonuclease domain-containing protein 2 [Prevotellaceae bacterium]